MATVPVTEQLIVHHAGIAVEQPDDDAYQLHFDVPQGQTARRYTIRFDRAGWHKFRTLVDAAGSGIEIARAVPDTNGDPPMDVFLGR